MIWAVKDQKTYRTYSAKNKKNLANMKIFLMQLLIHLKLSRNDRKKQYLNNDSFEIKQKRGKCQAQLKDGLLTAHWQFY